MKNSPEFAPQTERIRVQLVGHQHIAAPPEQVFPLMCAVREYEWVDGWDTDIIYTESGISEAGAIFRIPAPHSVVGGDISVITDYEPPHRFKAVAVGAHQVAIFEGHFSANNQGHTDIRWDACFTALDETGDRMLNDFDQAAWQANLKTVGEIGMSRVLAGNVYGYSPTKIDQ